MSMHNPLFPSLTPLAALLGFYSLQWRWNVTFNDKRYTHKCQLFNYLKYIIYVLHMSSLLRGNNANLCHQRNAIKTVNTSKEMDRWMNAISNKTTTEQVTWQLIFYSTKNDSTYYLLLLIASNSYLEWLHIRHIVKCFSMFRPRCFLFIHWQPSAVWWKAYAGWSFRGVLLIKRSPPGQSQLTRRGF